MIAWFSLVWFCLAVSVAGAVRSAEIAGQVTLKSGGLFGSDRSVKATGGVSVALLPLDGQPLPARPPATHRVVISRNAVQPVFITIRPGDTLQFVNEDNVYYKLFSLSRIQPFEIDLGKTGRDASQVIRLTDPGTWHVFCRIHGNLYFRVDVVDSPYISELDADNAFHFDRLAPGRWQVRLASPGSEVMTLETTAITTPPPLRIVMPVKGGESTRARLDLGNTGLIEQLYPPH